VNYRGTIAEMKDVFDALEARLAAAPVAGELTDEDRTAIAESLADYERGDFTVAIAPTPAAPRLTAEG